jgi:hypothetical protein
MIHHAVRAAFGCTLAICSHAAAQTTYLAVREAIADSHATTPGGALLGIPGIGNDFVLTADGQLVERGNGTAHLSAVLRRASAFDRWLVLELELSGFVPAHTLTASSYAPAGPVDPGAFRYYTAGTGTLRGLGAFSGGTLSLTVQAPLQIGPGANDRNVLSGVGGSFAVAAQSQPLFDPFVPTGAALLTATTFAAVPICASHVEPDAFGTGPARTLLSLPGAATDYLLIPAGTWTEASDGTATLAGTVRRLGDFADRWQCTFVCSGRRDPGGPGYPPANVAAPQLSTAAYVQHGGPVDTSVFRYYTTLAGTLVGDGSNAGGTISLAASRPVQVGVGADQSNIRYGAYAELTAAVTHQPNTRTLALSGTGTLRVNMDVMCILPAPDQDTSPLAVDNVTDGYALLTGSDLAWLDGMTIGPALISTTDPRSWVNGYLMVRSNTQVEVHPPQALALGTWPTRAFSPAGAGGARSITLTAPAAPRIRTQTDRIVHEAQDWVISQGNLHGAALTCLALSSDNLPSVIPGTIALDIGAQFTSLITFPMTFAMDAASGAVVIHLSDVPPVLHDLRLWCQAAVLALDEPPVLPIRTTDVWFTDYR